MTVRSIQRADTGRSGSLRRTTSGAALVVLLATMTACGNDNDSQGSDNGSQVSSNTAETEGANETPFEDESIETIKDEAIKDTRALQSVRMKGTFQDDSGENSAIDIRMDNKGSCRGSFTVGTAQAQFISAPVGSFLKGNRDFWVSASSESQADTLLGRLGDKWAKLEPGDDSFASFCDLDDLLDDFEDDGGTGGVEKGAVSEINGIEVIEITSTEDNDQDSQAFISTEGEHFIVRVVSKESDNPGDFTFSEFNSPVDLSPPPSADYIEASLL